MATIKDQVDEHKDQQSDKRLAQALGITLEELQQLDYKVTAITASDIVTAYDYKFSEHSPRQILDKIKGLSPEDSIQLGIYDLEKPGGEDDY